MNKLFKNIEKSTLIIYVSFWVLSSLGSLIFLGLAWLKIIDYGYTLGFTIGFLLSFLFWYLKNLLSDEILLNDKNHVRFIFYGIFMLDMVLVATVLILMILINKIVATSSLNAMLYPFNIFAFLGGSSILMLSIFISLIPKLNKKNMIKMLIIERRQK